MFATKHSLETVLSWSESGFTAEYEGEEAQAFLDYMENRIRLELIELINSLDRKGEIFLEVRKKGALSSFNKIIKEARRREWSSSLYPHQMIKDFVGCRIICLDESTLVSTFKALLQSEQIEIAGDGFELYSAPFRRFENKSSRYQRLVERLGLSKEDNKPSDQIKFTNYESLHCDITFGDRERFRVNKVDQLIHGVEVNRQARYRAEAEGIVHLYEKMGYEHRKLVSSFPIECQMRTMLEHLWASEEHKYVYEKIKSGTVADNDGAVDVLRGAFTALKYHYNSIDDIRDIVRNVSSNYDGGIKPFYSGTSKDISDVRTTFFPEGDHALRLIREAGTLYSAVQADPQRPEDHRNSMRSIYEKIQQAYREIQRGL